MNIGNIAIYWQGDLALMEKKQSWSAHCLELRICVSEGDFLDFT